MAEGNRELLMSMYPNETTRPVHNMHIWVPQQLQSLTHFPPTFFHLINYMAFSFFLRTPVMTKYNENVHARMNTVALWAVGSFHSYPKLDTSCMFFFLNLRNCYK